MRRTLNKTRPVRGHDRTSSRELHAALFPYLCGTIHFHSVIDSIKLSNRLSVGVRQLIVHGGLSVTGENFRGSLVRLAINRLSIFRSAGRATAHPWDFVYPISEKRLCIVRRIIRPLFVVVFPEDTELQEYEVRDESY